MADHKWINSFLDDPEDLQGYETKNLQQPPFPVYPKEKKLQERIMCLISENTATQCNKKIWNHQKRQISTPVTK